MVPRKLRRLCVRRRGAAPAAFAEVTLLASLLVPPYAYAADLVGYSLLLGLAAEQRRWRIGVLDSLFWLWPGLCLFVSAQTGLLFTPLVICMALSRACYRLAVTAPATR